MPRRSSREPHPFEIVMHELAGEQAIGNLQEHLNGRLAGIGS